MPSVGGSYRKRGGDGGLVPSVRKIVGGRVIRVGEGREGSQGSRAVRI